MIINKPSFALSILVLSLGLTACSDKESPKREIKEIKQKNTDNEDMVFYPVTLTKEKQEQIKNTTNSSNEQTKEETKKEIANNLAVNNRPVDHLPEKKATVNTPPTTDTKKVEEKKSNHADDKVSEMTLKIGDKFSRKELKKRYPEPVYKSFKFDVNGDGKRDLIIANNRYKDKKGKHSGDDLFVFLTDKKQYKLDLISSNFDTDGSLEFSGIMPRANGNGFILSTALPYSVANIHVQDYMFSKVRNKWRINQFVSKAKVKGNRHYCKEKVKYNATDGTGNFQPNKKMKHCSLPPVKYTVKAKKAEILNDDFVSNKPATYFIKGDMIEQNDIYFKQNEDWVYASYKDGKKSGWVRRDSLKKAKKVKKAKDIVTPPKDTSKKYKVTSDKAEIVKEDFTPNNPRNYFVKDDMVEERSIHFNKDPDWIYVTYKDGKKTGWVRRKDLKGANNYQIPAKKYKVTSDSAEIVKDDFTPNNPRNYFVKGDMVEEKSIHFNKNPDWIYITYKNGKKVGWVKREDLKGVP